MNFDSSAQKPYVDHFPFSYEEARAHELQPHRHTIPLRGVDFPSNQIQLKLTISPGGNVIDVEPGGALKFWPSVQREIKGWKFVPFEHDGKPVIAEVEEYIDLMPPERFPVQHITPPALHPDSKIEIQLQRTGCYGSCPSYIVTVTEDRVTFWGRTHVEQTGEHMSAVNAAAVRTLAKKFIALDFYSMNDRYVASITDNPTYVLSISIDGKKKIVKDYVGSMVGMPLTVTELEDDVDRLARTDRWTGHEKAPTLP